MIENTRDFIGYGEHPPHPRWPNRAQLAVSFVLNYEEGAESCLLDGDPGSETLLCDLVGIKSNEGGRNMAVESLYEYGSRSGFWRILRLFGSRKLPLTVYACGNAIVKNPEATKAMVREGWEIATHGYRWLDYSNPKQDDDVKKESEHIFKSVELQEVLCGYRPLGFYQGKPSPYSRQVALNAGILYDNDLYNDDLPYWSQFHRHTTDNSPLLLIPYTLSNNDMRFAALNGFSNGDQFFSFLKDTFDYLYKEGESLPKMMTIGLHCRLVGHPGRAGALERFMEYIDSKNVWICRRIDIALHWYRHHYPSETVSESSPEWRKRLGEIGQRPRKIERLLNHSNEPVIDMNDIINLMKEEE